MSFDIQDIMKSLSEKRPVFHSEADFQLAFAWEIKEHFPECEIRLEYVIPDLGYHLDVLVWLDGQLVPIELKYKTLKSLFTIKTEIFSLKGHGAQDIGRYDIIKDIVRIEHIVGKLKCPIGYTVSLTNDPSYWIPANRMTIADDLRLPEGRVLTGDLGWAEHAGAGSTKGRENRLVLNCEYPLHWVDYSTLAEGRNGSFRYLSTACRVSYTFPESM